MLGLVWCGLCHVVVVAIFFTRQKYTIRPPHL
jgi:hypothetical protein